MRFFDNTPVGRIVNRLTNDILTIDESLPWFMRNKINFNFVDVFLENFSRAVGYPIGIII